MRRRLRSAFAACSVLLLSGCAMLAPPGGEGPAHPDLDVEVMMQLLHDIDVFITDYAWLLALLGLA